MYEIEKFTKCREVMEYRSKFESFEDAWKACERGDWMLWLAARIGVEKRKLVLVAGLCANTVRHLMRDTRSRDAVDAAIAYGNGEINEDGLEAARAAARAATNAAYAANNAAYAADNAAYAADNAAYVASDAADAAAYVAAYAAAYATDAAYAPDAVSDAADAAEYSKKQTADICRQVLTQEVMKKIELI